MVFATRTKNTTNSAMFVVFFGGGLVRVIIFCARVMCLPNVMWLYSYFYEKHVARREGV